MGVLYRGVVLGLIIAAPVGPVGLMCIRRTLQKGLLIGLVTGLGAACADALFGAIAVFGVTAILGFIRHYQASIQLIGGLIVLGAAWHTWNDHPRPPHAPEFVSKVMDLPKEVMEVPQAKTPRGAWRAALTGFIITLTNPLTLFGTLAVVATFGGVTSKTEASVLIGGIFTGSALWWLMLSSGVGLLRCHCTEKRIVVVNRVTAVALSALALWAIVLGVIGYSR